MHPHIASLQIHPHPTTRLQLLDPSTHTIARMLRFYSPADVNLSPHALAHRFDSHTLTPLSMAADDSRIRSYENQLRSARRALNCMRKVLPHSIGNVEPRQLLSPAGIDVSIHEVANMEEKGREFLLWALEGLGHSGCTNTQIVHICMHRLGMKHMKEHSAHIYKLGAGNSAYQKQARQVLDELQGEWMEDSIGGACDDAAELEHQ